MVRVASLPAGSDGASGYALRLARAARFARGFRPKKNRGKKKQEQGVWTGPVDEDGYPPIWTPELRRSVRASQDFRCLWCGQLDKEAEGTLHVHHRNGNKRDCRKENLVALCPDCHVLLAHHGKHSLLKGPELRIAIKFQELLRDSWLGRKTRPARRIDPVVEAEQELEQLYSSLTRG